MRSKAPLVSFAIPSYNYGRFLGECLDSVFAQEGSFSFEIVVVDDGSTDETSEVLRRYRDERLRVIRHERNRGHAATINEALGVARGQFIARIDPDDRYRPHFLVSTLERFGRHPQVGLVYGDVALIDAAGRVTQEGCDRRHAGREYVGNEFLALLEENFICSPTVIARREAWLGVPPVPRWLAFHDWYFTLMMARAWDFCYVNRVLAEYRVHPGNHHTKVVRDRTEERSVFWLLHTVFADKERSEALEAEKQARRRRVYAAHWFTLGRKYFGLGMYADARRCFLRVVRCHPMLALRADLLRWLVATYVGPRAYERAKTAYRALVRRAETLGPVRG